MANPFTALSGDLLTSLTGNVQKAKLIIRSNTQSAASGAAARVGGSLSTAQIASQAGAALAGGSQAAGEADSPENGMEIRDPDSGTYILNTNTRRFHLPSCSGVSSMKDSNKETYRGSRDALLEEGYTPCGICSP